MKKREATDEYVWLRFRERNLDADVEKIVNDNRVTVLEFFSGRMPHAVKARHAFWHVLKNLGWSYSSIAQLFLVDHASVMKALNK